MKHQNLVSKLTCFFQINQKTDLRLRKKVSKKRKFNFFLGMLELTEVKFRLGVDEGWYFIYDFYILHFSKITNKHLKIKNIKY